MSPLETSDPPVLPDGVNSAPDQAQVLWDDAARRTSCMRWLDDLAARHGLLADSLRPASADASFRRYLRIDRDGGGSFIVMDAPPGKEDCEPFVRIADLMRRAGMRVPLIHDWHRSAGFLLLEDLGQDSMIDALDPDLPQANQALFMQALDQLLAWQLASRPGLLPVYDRALLERELALFPQWYLGHHRGITLDPGQRSTLEASFQTIVEHNLAGRPVYVHRDFMPRNLMLVASAQDQGRAGLAVLDFQDAVYGPISYDIASLMRDAFISWDEEVVLDITVRYWQRARAAGLPVDADFGDFYRAVEWMGLQRHLKVAGIFARLSLRDGKPRYLADCPRFIAYIRATCARYRELGALLRLLDQVEGLQAEHGYAFGRL